MASNPIEATIEQVLEGKPSTWKDNVIYEEVLIQGEGTPRPFWTKDGTPAPEPGPVKGWWNQTQKGTRYFKRADGPGSGAQQQSFNGAGRDDATGKSIERQVAAKCARDIIIAMGVDRTTFAADFRFLTDAVADAIRGE
jgi:hypothetical protein